MIVAGQDLVDLGTSPTAPAGWVFEGDFVGVDADPQDEVGHGTHVAGTVSALSNNGVGVAGVTWQCRLMPVRVLARIRRLSDNRVSGVGSAADIAAGIRWAVDHGARVINMSLGGDVDTTVERNAVAYAIQQGVVVVAAMGNDNTTTPSYPGAYPDVIAVGATNPNDTRASFSNMGPHIDVAAPGVGIQSTYWDNTYANLQGTSMASPHVAGVAALILSCNPNLPAAQVGQIIRDTANRCATTPPTPSRTTTTGTAWWMPRPPWIGRVRRLRRGPSSPARASRSAVRRSGKRARAWSRSARANRSVPVNRSPANRSAVRRSSPFVLRWASARR